jgi:hypothetical protein
MCFNSWWKIRVGRFVTLGRSRFLCISFNSHALFSPPFCRKAAFLFNPDHRLQSAVHHDPPVAPRAISGLAWPLPDSARRARNRITAMEWI